MYSFLKYLDIFFFFFYIDWGAGMGMEDFSKYFVFSSYSEKITLHTKCQGNVHDIGAV